MKIDPFPGTLTKEWVVRPYKTKSGDTAYNRVKAWVLSDEQREWFCRWFPEVENKRLKKVCGMSYSTIYNFARQFGLKKSEEGLRGIWKRQAAHVKRLCEKNGYYDSLRGKPVSEACQKGIARMWQEIRDGEREHPIVKLRRTNPHRHRLMSKRMSEGRKELIRKERQRAVYGLPRKTKLTNVLTCKYTKRQCSHRYNAMQRGYILMEDCSEQGGERYNIYYDAKTQRAPRFERNLIADGFTLKEWKD